MKTIKQDMKYFPDGTIVWYPSTISQMKQVMQENLEKSDNKTFLIKELNQLNYYADTQAILIFFKKNKKKEDFLGWATVVGSEEDSAQRFMAQYQQERMRIN